MEAIDVLATGARNEGLTKTPEDWAILLGRPRLLWAMDRRLLVGPSGTDTTRCYRCTQPGHPAPIQRSKAAGHYDVHCEEAGIFTIPAGAIEGFHVSERVFYHEVAVVFGVPAPEVEFIRFTDNLSFLGTAHIGKRPFSLIIAESLRSESEIRDLLERNRQGFAREPGLILHCDGLLVSHSPPGSHAIRRYGEVLDFDANGIRPRWGEVRNLLGLPGRPAKKTTQKAEAQKVFEMMQSELGKMPEGERALRLFREKRPDLSHLSDSTLYAAKSAGRGTSK